MAIRNEQTFLELISNYHQNPERFVFFVGAGLSQPLFPSWGSLLKEFINHAKESGLQHDEAELLSYIEAGENYLDIAEACISVMGNVRYRDLMEKVFDKDFSINEVPESYKALIDLSPNTIITTNYDRIPEIAGKGKYRISTNKNSSEASRFFSSNKNVVFKIHGDITDHSSIVLTTSDYQKIINNNQSTRNLLNSILSTKILIFVGFSLSDPHIGVILENIKSINNGLPLSHYVLLNEASSFKISSFENKYGVKIIPYTPEDNLHSEVVEFLRALNHDVTSAPEKIDTKFITNIDTSEKLVKYVESTLKEIIFGSGISVFYSNSNLYISFTPSGETKGEIQKEILSIIKLMHFKCDLIGKIHIHVVMNTPPLVNIDESQPIVVKATIDFSNSNKYANKELSTSTLWKLMSFHIPPSLSNVFQGEDEIEFPMSMGVVEG